jgi:hypothetical protein
MSQTNNKYGNEQMAITPKLGKAELLFFCIANLTNEVYLPILSISEHFLSLEGA